MLSLHMALGSVSRTKKKKKKKATKVKGVGMFFLTAVAWGSRAAQ